MPAITLPDLNNAKLDVDHIAAIATSTELTATDRLGQTKRTLKGQMKAVDDELAAKLDNAQSQINVKVVEAAGHAADSAASALEAYGYLQAYRATSYGALASDPATDPLGNPPTVGDEYFNTTSNLLKRWNGYTWQASDINTANFAATTGSSLSGYIQPGAGAVATTVQDRLRKELRTSGYASLGNALTAATTAGALLVVDSPVTVSANISTGVPLLVVPGGQITVATGVTLNINGSFQAGIFRCFVCQGTGKVAFVWSATAFVYPEWWGAVADNVTDCSSSFTSACGCGVFTVQLNAGTYLFHHTENLPQFYHGLVKATNDFQLIGKGKNKTILANSQATAIYVGNMFYLDDEVSGYFKDLTFQGPLIKPTTGSSAPQCTGVQMATTRTKREVFFENVNFTGWFVQGFSKTNGYGTGYFFIKFSNCELQAYQGCVGAFTPNGSDGHFHMYDCVFWEGSVPPTDPGFPFAHPAYIHPHINLHLERCRFVKWYGNKYAVHHFGSSGQSSIHAKYARYIDCRFEADNGGLGVLGVEVSDVIHSVFERCYFAPNITRVVLTKQVGTTLRKCEFPANIEHGVSGGNLIVDDCVITANGLMSLSYGGNWKFSNSKLISVANGNTLIRVNGNITDPTKGSLELFNCLFQGVTGTDVSSSAIYSQGAIPIIMRNCRVTGHYGGASPDARAFMSLENALLTFTANGNIFDHDSGSPFQQILSVNVIPADGAIRMFDNIYSEYCGIRDAQFTTPTKQRIALQQGTRFEAIASASTVRIFLAYDTYLISGTATINNISLGDSSQKFIEGRIRLIATGAWSTSSTGNIIPKTTAARAVNSVVELLWNPVSAVWVEV